MLAIPLSPLQVRKRFAILTSSEDVVAHVELIRPALAGEVHHPQLFDGPTPSPCHDSAGAEHGVDRHYDEPYKALLPARGDAQEGHGKGRLAPGGANDHEGARKRRHKEHRGIVLEGYVPRVLAEAVLDG